MGNRRTWLGLSVVAVAAATCWGYHSERRAMDAAGKPPIAFRTVVRRLATPADQRSGLDRLEDLRHSIGKSTLSSSEIDGLWNLIRAFSHEQVQLALAMLPDDSDLEVNGVIKSMLFYRWAEMDPFSAAEAVTPPWEHQVLSAWANQDVDAMVRWAKSSTSGSAKNRAMLIATKIWLAGDLESGLAKAWEECPEQLEYVLSQVAEDQGDDPEFRQRLLSILGREGSEGEWKAFWKGVARRLNPAEPDAAMNLAAEMADAGAPPQVVEAFKAGWLREARLRFRRDDEAILSGLDVMPPEVKLWDHRTLVSSASPEKTIDGTLSWAEQRGEVELVASTLQGHAGSLLDGDLTLRADGVDASLLSKQFATWQRMAPAAAQEWYASQPMELRQMIESQLVPHEFR